MTRVWVLGSGQLGTMLRHAGIPLALDVVPVDFDPATPVPAPGADDQVTAEIEHWPDTDATRVLAAHPRFANRDTFARLADRLPQKQLLDNLNVATSPWCPVTGDTIRADLHHKLGDRLLLKRRRGGYDGNGQLWLREDRAESLPEDWRETAIAESAIAFDEEVSLVAARDRRGTIRSYPLTLNLHVNGVLTASIAPLHRLRPLQAQAETMLGSILEELDYIGVMAMECFRVGDRLLVNELAPRVHNSGHWTQAGASVSQFESHLRAICDLPLAQPTVKAPTVMINLLGTERDHRWLDIPEAELFWYGKSVRPGRKLGHINLCGGTGGDLTTALDGLLPLLPDSYHPVIDWVRRSLAGDITA